jgi:hypothetical protein
VSQKSGQKIFQEIVGTQEKISILTQVVNQGIPIRARVQPEVEFITKGLRWSSPVRMLVEAPEGLKLGLQRVTLQFDLNRERYFTMADLAYDDWKLYFLCSHPIHRLQRRSYQRLFLPWRYPNRVLLMRVNEEIWNQECELIDISLGGCSLKLPYRALDIPNNAFLMLDINIGPATPFLHIAQVRYKRLDKYEGKSMVRLGLQFQHHPKFDFPLKEAIQTFTSDLFTNWSERNQS